MITNVNGIVLTDESTETIRLFQENGIDSHINVLEKMIDFLLCDGVEPAELRNPSLRISYIQDLRYIEKLMKTFIEQNKNGK